MCRYLQDSDPISLLVLGDVHFLRDVASLGCGPTGNGASWGCGSPAFVFIPGANWFLRALLDAGQSLHSDWLAGGSQR